MVSSTIVSCCTQTIMAIGVTVGGQRIFGQLLQQPRLMHNAGCRWPLSPRSRHAPSLAQRATHSFTSPLKYVWPLSLFFVFAAHIQIPSSASAAAAALPSFASCIQTCLVKSLSSFAVCSSVNVYGLIACATDMLLW